MKAFDYLGKLKKEKNIEPNADMNNMFVRYVMEKFAEQHALENCTCGEDETTGSMEEWVCNNCGRVQK